MVGFIPYNLLDLCARIASTGEFLVSKSPEVFLEMNEAHVDTNGKIVVEGMSWEEFSVGGYYA